MSASILPDCSARSILEHYPRDLVEASWNPLGNAGGFSGARIWRGKTAAGDEYCLREWPFPKMTESKLRLIHKTMDALRDLPFVPGLARTSAGESWLQCGENFWEINEWMPGKADFRIKPTNARLFAAMRCLAMIHEVLKPVRPALAPAPAVQRVLGAMRNWRGLLSSGWKPDFSFAQPESVMQLARRAWEAVSSNTYSIEFALLDWENRSLPVQVCLCDVWHDHILYEGESVSGIVDYGAVKFDCVAVDLARLLGSIIPDQPERMHDALFVYSAIHPVPREVLELAAVLDRAGSTVGLTNWLRWLYFEKRQYGELTGVVRRMEALLKRVETKRAPLFNT